MMRAWALIMALMAVPGHVPCDTSAFDRAPAAFVCPECRVPTCVVVTYYDEYTQDPYVFDTCDMKRHVHDWSWKRWSLRCQWCGHTWDEVEEAAACPSCGWTRSNAGAYQDPCPMGDGAAPPP